MKVQDGTYNFVDGVLTAFRELGATELRRVEAILRERQRGELQMAEAITQVAAVSAELGELMQRVAR